MDELIYIVLSQRTRAMAYQSAYSRLKKRFPTWDLLLSARYSEIERILRPSGMSRLKAKTIKAIAEALAAKFGRVTLDQARTWSNDRLLRFLRSLPRVSYKTALCVMMYSMNRQVFPADSNIIRVCHRLGITSYDNLHHKKAQLDLAPLFPDGIRYSLHVNMMAHGRYICRPIPKCDRCEIRNFCEYYRSRQRRRNGGRRVYTVADVFSGAGGMTNGFVQTGFRVALAADSDPNAIDTLELNHPGIPEDRIVRTDLRQLETSRLRSLARTRPVDVVVGGPPCQGFSMAGARARTNINGCRFKDDPRNRLYREFLRIVSALRPTFLVLENVPGILSARGGLYVRQTLDNFRALDPPYTVQIATLQASDFGIPQRRRRVFFIGRRGTRGADRRLDRVRARIKALKSSGPAPSLWDAIADLPRIKAGEGGEVLLATPLRGRRGGYRSYVCNGSRFIFNHLARAHNPRDLELYALLRPGEWGWDAIEKYHRPDLMVYRNDVWLDKYRRLREDEPSPTIVAHLARMGNMFIHPRVPRGLTVREAARLQSFTDDFIFLGSFGCQFQMIGNAVPPLMAEAIAKAIKEELGVQSLTKR